jgi:hypothetical protein
MLRRWSAPLAVAALALGSLIAAAGPAAAAPVAHHPGTTLTRPGGAIHGFHPGSTMLRAPSRTPSRGRASEVESSNWSGYAQTGGNGAFSSVSASWTQPTAHCTSRQDQYAAFWVGLDGYSSSSVEQTGTDSDCDGTTPDYYGWYEMYPANPVYYDNPVAPGDSISASVTFSGSETYTLVLTDHTQGWTQKQVINESGLDRSSAEVITEAPCCTASGGILPLADFGTVSYAGATGASTFTGSNATEIIMVDTRGRQEDSTSSIAGGGDFSNTWIRSS